MQVIVRFLQLECIQIHLMLLFNSIWRSKFRREFNSNTSHVIIQSNGCSFSVPKRKFKYISCYYSITPLVTAATTDQNSNTSHVIIQCIVHCGQHGDETFKYISCYYSILKIQKMEEEQYHSNTSHVIIQ